MRAARTFLTGLGNLLPAAARGAQPPRLFLAPDGRLTVAVLAGGAWVEYAFDEADLDKRPGELLADLVKLQKEEPVTP